MKLINYLIKKGFDTNKAQTLINEGKINVNHNQVVDPNLILNKDDKIEIATQKQWVSRGAYKLIEAIKQFELDFNNKVILDIGASTGGFTDVSLQYGAKKVYALDVGTNQLDYKLRTNSRVVVYEKTNLKIINSQMFDEAIDIVVCDVSFISLYHVFKVLDTIKHPNLEVIVLIKPQFEATKQQVAKGGYVNIKYHEEIIEKVNNFAVQNGFSVIKTIRSPIMGLKAKNIEYISYYRFKTINKS